LSAFETIGYSIDLESDGSVVLELSGECRDSTSLQLALPAATAAMRNFRVNLGTARRHFPAPLIDFDNLSRALANNSIENKGARATIRCVIDQDICCRLILAIGGSGSSENDPPADMNALDSAERRPSDAGNPLAAPLPGASTDLNLPPGLLERGEQFLASAAKHFGREKSVLVIGKGYSSSQETFRLAGRLRDLAPTLGDWRDAHFFDSSEAELTVVVCLAPIDDLRTLARRIDFARVVAVDDEKRRIVVSPRD
jgi:hypothetical protein